MLSEPGKTVYAGHVDSSCSWTAHEDPGQMGWILMLLKCDMKPMLNLFEQLLPSFGGPRYFNIPSELNSLQGVDKSESAMKIWQDYLSMVGLIEPFFKGAQEALTRKEMCTYPTIKRFGQLRHFAMGSSVLTAIYDLMVIDYHKNCLNEVLKRLPQVPSLVREVVQIYRSGAEKKLQLDLNAPATLGRADEKFEFDAEEAIARNGPLKAVGGLMLSLPSLDEGSVEQQFKNQCKQLLVELEDRWQTMEMMNEMLASDSNAIKSFNNYISHLLLPTKYADACSQLSLKG